MRMSLKRVAMTIDRAYGLIVTLAATTCLPDAGHYLPHTQDELPGPTWNGWGASGLLVSFLRIAHTATQALAKSAVPTSGTAGRADSQQPKRAPRSKTLAIMPENSAPTGVTGVPRPMRHHLHPSHNAKGC